MVARSAIPADACRLSVIGQDDVAWSPDGAQLASSGLDGMVKVWQVV